jgi:N-sulfoglucosamine sulfohydrolase
MKTNYTKGLTGLLVLTGFTSCEEPQRELLRPNILLCLADDISFPHMGAYGTEWVHTPNFDRLAAQGILFTNAYTPNAKCGPSRSTILTGRNPWQLEEAANHFCYFPSTFKVYPEVFEEAGYHVGFTGKGWAPGNPGMVNGARRKLTGNNYSTIHTKPPTTGISPNDYSANFDMFLNDNPDHKPFVFWYGSMEPHRGYEFASSLNKDGRTLDEIDLVPPFWPDTDSVRTDMLDYAMEIAHFDMHLGRMIDMLESRDMLDNTLIVVTSDNGMPFPRVKGQKYEFSNHMPLAIMWKDGIKNPGRVVEQHISFIDFAPTFFDVSGIDPDEAGMAPITGTSLFPILEDRRNHTRLYNDYVLIGKERHDMGRPDDQGYPIRGLVKDGFLYIHNFETGRWPSGNPETGYPNADESPTKTVTLRTLFNPEKQHYWRMNFGLRPTHELYNIIDDPYCIINFADSEQHQKQLDYMKEFMFARLREQEDPRMFGKGHIFDEYEYSGADRNYYNRLMAGEEITPSWINASDKQSMDDVLSRTAN